MSSPLPVASPKLAPDSKADVAAARRVLEYAGEALSALSASLGENFSLALDVLLAVKGRVVVSGMGKSGHVGQKIAATLSSTGTPAQFVHPAEASHGDLGALTREDALLMLSNSGETAELSSLITYAKRFEIPLIESQEIRIRLCCKQPMWGFNYLSRAKPVLSDWHRPPRPQQCWRLAMHLPSH